MEILAPVGNLINLKTAVYSGADAVYLGAGLFNARAKCEEITLSNLQDVVNFCHFHNVKVYLTVNTIIKQNEIAKLKEFLLTAYNCGVDAFILQDFAVYQIVRELGLDIELHASTQMGIHNLAGAKQVEKLGFTRVVLSRETNLQEIKNISQNTNLQIEYFVQGALCVSFSGNCYLSALTNKKSGNRGECSQLCRLKYNCNQSNQYYFSAKDLCLINNLQELIKAGVTSAKIEGRMRRSGYVAQAVQSYKKALMGVDTSKEIENLKGVFCRGDFSYDGYLYGEKQLIDKVNHNHTGVEIGKVTSVDKFKDIFKIHIATNHKLTEGDGIKVISNGNQISIGVGNTEKTNDGYYIYSTAKPQVSGLVNLTVDSVKEKNITDVCKKLNYSLKVTAKQNQKFYAKLKCKNAEIEFYGDLLDVAKNSALSQQDIFGNFQKVAEYDFNLTNVELDTDGVFLPKSVLNEYRRQCLQLLYNKVLENYKFNRVEYTFNICQMPQHKSNVDKNYIFNDVSQTKGLSKNNTIFIYAPTDYNKLESVPFDYYLLLPFFATSPEIELIDGILQRNEKIKGVYINNLYGCKYALTHKVIASYYLNVANQMQKNILENLGVSTVCLSVEEDLLQINGYKYGGKVSQMNFVHCPKKTICNNSCSANCKCDFDYKTQSGKLLTIRTTKLINCYFELLSENNNRQVEFMDLR